MAIIYGSNIYNDLINGTSGNDSLYGGTKTFTGFNGRDTILGGAGNDYLDGGNEDETKPYIDPTNNTPIATPYVDPISGQTIIIYNGDSLDGGSGNDWIYGRQGYDYLYGNSGNDYLDGGTGGDTVIGGDGSDILVGGQGSDVLAGGKGGIANDAYIDWFVYTNANEIGDEVKDFTKGLDKIVLNASSFGLEKTNLVNPPKPFSFSLAKELFTNTTQFHRLSPNDYEQKIVGGTGNYADLSSALASATKEIVAILPNGVVGVGGVPPASLYFDSDITTPGTGYQLIATFTNGVTPTLHPTNTNAYDILVY